MADESLSVVASLLRDSNNKLDKLHSDNEKNDTAGDIIKAALPEILSDAINTQLNIDSINQRQADENKNDDKQMKADQVASDKQLEILREIKNPMVDLGEIKKPMIDLGLAIPKSGFNAFSKKASDISAEKDLPSDFKLMISAISPKNLIEGMKIGLTDMFKEFGGGLKNIGSGIKKLVNTAKSRLTPAQEDNLEKKDGMFKKAQMAMWKTVTSKLGGILKFAKKSFSLATKAALGLIAAAFGAAALFALAKLIESPAWGKFVNGLRSLADWGASAFKWLEETVGFDTALFVTGLGLLAAAMAFMNPIATGTIMYKAIKGLSKFALKMAGFRVASDAALLAADNLSGTGKNKKGFFKRLLSGAKAGFAAFWPLLLGYVIAELGLFLRDRYAKKEAEMLAKPIAKTKEGREKQLKETLVASSDSAKERARTELQKKNIAAAEKKKVEIRAAMKKDQDGKEINVFGATPKKTTGLIVKELKRVFKFTTFEGTGKERVRQLKNIIDKVSDSLKKSKGFLNLKDDMKKEYLKSFDGAIKFMLMGAGKQYTDQVRKGTKKYTPDRDDVEQGINKLTIAKQSLITSAEEVFNEAVAARIRRAAAAADAILAKEAAAKEAINQELPYGSINSTTINNKKDGDVTYYPTAPIFMRRSGNMGQASMYGETYGM